MARAGGIGASLFLIAIGAVLAWAVEVDAEGLNLNMIGVILLVVGAIGLVLSLFASIAASDSDSDVTVVER